ncbi:MAG TPA: 50S ribosomal protein L22 [Myxococcota bacterium]|nr:50S ribosomal protein L22 [Myxococcota bacterium]
MQKHKRGSLHYLRISPRKVRAVVDTIRGRQVEDALAVLDFTCRAAAVPLAKILRSAVANVANSGNVDIDTLVVKEIMVDQGPMLKRFRPRAMGRASLIQKKTSHVRFMLDERK